MKWWTVVTLALAIAEMAEQIGYADEMGIGKKGIDDPLGQVAVHTVRRFMSLFEPGLGGVLFGK